MVEDTGIISLISALAVLVLALVTRRSFEALLGGTLIGYVLTSGFRFFGAFVASMLSVGAWHSAR
ncbi:MAG: hypothetical protein E2P02_18195 [Acidobacteria bacterium]|nr:MAG: hypothetical protein E2P02_18195 [Acidobacteriota bacterium]